MRDLDRDVGRSRQEVVQEYAGPVTLQHVDLYRLTAAEVDDLGLEDLMEGTVLAVEWPDRWAAAPPGIAITIDTLTGDTRRVVVER